METADIPFIENGRVVYAVLSFGEFLGPGNILFAVPRKTLIMRWASTRFEDINNRLTRLNNRPHV